jgi:hypothetical protein
MRNAASLQVHNRPLFCQWFLPAFPLPIFFAVRRRAGDTLNRKRLMVITHTLNTPGLASAL